MLKALERLNAILSSSLLHVSNEYYVINHAKHVPTYLLHRGYGSRDALKGGKTVLQPKIQENITLCPRTSTSS
jgi:hypothetical protein